MWQLSHEKDLSITAPPLEDWIQILKDINQTQKPNPLEELPCLAQQFQNEAQEEDPGSSETSQSQIEPSTEQEQQQEEEELGEELDSSIDVEGEYWIKQRDFDHSKSAGFRWRKSSGQQFRFGEHKGPYIKRGKQRTIFNPKVDFPGTKFWRMVNLILA